MLSLLSFQVILHIHYENATGTNSAKLNVTLGQLRLSHKYNYRYCHSGGIPIITGPSANSASEDLRRPYYHNIKSCDTVSCYPSRAS